MELHPLKNKGAFIMEKAKFEVGKTYYAHSACNYDCVFTYTVISRTAQTATLEDSFGKRSRRKIHNDGAAEWILPQGSYSMAPTISADRALEDGDEAEAETPAATEAEEEKDRAALPSNVIDFAAAKAKRDEARQLEAAKDHFLNEILPYLSKETLSRLAESMMNGDKKSYQAEMARAFMEATLRKA